MVVLEIMRGMINCAAKPLLRWVQLRSFEWRLSFDAGSTARWGC
jgi:hypothetical protein